VAGLTDVTRLDMLGIFAGGSITIMTAEAVARHPFMIKVRWRPGLSAVTITTLLASG